MDAKGKIEESIISMHVELLNYFLRMNELKIIKRVYLNRDMVYIFLSISDKIQSLLIIALRGINDSTVLTSSNE
jgi:hypothetical protein